MAGTDVARTEETNKWDRLYGAWDRLKKQFGKEAESVRLELDLGRPPSERPGGLALYDPDTMTMRLFVPSLMMASNIPGIWKSGMKGYAGKDLEDLAISVMKHEYAHHRTHTAERRTGEKDVPLSSPEPGEARGRRYQAGDPPHGALWHRINAYLGGSGSELKMPQIGMPLEWKRRYAQTSREGS